MNKSDIVKEILNKSDVLILATPHKIYQNFLSLKRQEFDERYGLVTRTYL
mgnify:CR=1 FL=1